jgi:hypothetical protein
LVDHKKRYSRKTDKQGIHAKKYEGMAIRSLDRPQEEKQRNRSAEIPENKSISNTQLVNKPHDDDSIEGNPVVFQTMDSSIIESTPGMVEDTHFKNQDRGDSARKMEAKKAPTSVNMASSQAVNSSSVSQQLRANQHSSHQGHESPYTKASKLDSSEVAIGESKQRTNIDNVETSRTGIKQEEDYKTKEDEDRLSEESHFNSKPSLMHSVPWFPTVDAWTKQYVEFTDNAFMMIDYWLDLISATWLGKTNKTD